MRGVLCNPFVTHGVGADGRGAAADESPPVGYLAPASLSARAARAEAFRQGLRDLGYVEGKNIVLSGDLRRVHHQS
jgi:hypothetical protein